MDTAPCLVATVGIQVGWLREVTFSQIIAEVTICNPKTERPCIAACRRGIFLLPVHH